MATVAAILPDPIWCLAAFVLCVAVDCAIHTWFYILGRRGDLPRVLRNMGPVGFYALRVGLCAARIGYSIAFILLILTTVVL
ncbi:hypothetical protein BFP70_08535 [Thioclava sp. SK-1]|uniref:hypothetical protein n=1 Tax=Thioclava sp. SK-1 TaxID=1889770 RepID=UPI00082705FB|nr:hypothetical protein [Thioclava sp. SK-1]OCX66141.1 hypothetical protein BFP70_08535 [Thioclava sp. SK-1]